MSEPVERRARSFQRAVTALGVTVGRWRRLQSLQRFSSRCCGVSVTDENHRHTPSCRPVKLELNLSRGAERAHSELFVREARGEQDSVCRALILFASLNLRACNLLC